MENAPALAALLDGAAEADGRQTCKQAVARGLTAAALVRRRRLLLVLHRLLAAILARRGRAVGGVVSMLGRGRAVVTLLLRWGRAVMALGRVAVGLEGGLLAIRVD